MITTLRNLFVVMSLLALGGCQHRHPTIPLAEGCFSRQNPEVEITKSRILKRDPQVVVVGIQFVNTPQSAFPLQAGIWEREFVFHQAEDGEWKLVESGGDNYIRPAK